MNGRYPAQLVGLFGVPICILLVFGGLAWMILSRQSAGLRLQENQTVVGLIEHARGLGSQPAPIDEEEMPGAALGWRQEEMDALFRELEVRFPRVYRELGLRAAHQAFRHNGCIALTTSERLLRNEAGIQPMPSKGECWQALVDADRRLELGEIALARTIRSQEFLAYPLIAEPVAEPWLGDRTFKED